MKVGQSRFRVLISIIMIAVCGAFWAHAQQSTPVRSVGSWMSLFNGSTLDGWNGREGVWKVEDGAITGEILGGPGEVSTNIFWTGGQPADFELKAEIRMEGDLVNTGVVYRSDVQPPAAGANAGRGAINAPYLLRGPQLDLEATNRYSGQYYEIAMPRGLLVRRGEMLETDGTQSEVIAQVGDAKVLASFVKSDDWNQVRVIAHNDTMIHVINGHVMSVVVDRNASARKKGFVAFQLEGQGKVRIRNVLLRTD